MEDSIKIIVKPYNFNNKLITANDVKNILEKYEIDANIVNLAIYQKAFIQNQNYIIEFSQVKKYKNQLSCKAIIKKNV